MPLNEETQTNPGYNHFTKTRYRRKISTRSCFFNKSLVFSKHKYTRILIISCWTWFHHHHHVVLVARISLTLSRHFSLSFITSGRSYGQHPVSSHSCWMYVRAGRPAFARPCVGVHKSTSLMSSSLLLQQCPACLVRLTWIVFVIGGRWLYSWCLVGCCRQDLFKIARSINKNILSAMDKLSFKLSKNKNNTHILLYQIHLYEIIDLICSMKSPLALRG